MAHFICVHVCYDCIIIIMLFCHFLSMNSFYAGMLDIKRHVFNY